MDLTLPKVFVLARTTQLEFPAHFGSIKMYVGPIGLYCKGMCSQYIILQYTDFC